MMASLAGYKISVGTTSPLVLSPLSRKSPISPLSAFRQLSHVQNPIATATATANPITDMSFSSEVVSMGLGLGAAPFATANIFESLLSPLWSHGSFTSGISSCDDEQNSLDYDEDLDALTLVEVEVDGSSPVDLSKNSCFGLGHKMKSKPTTGTKTKTISFASGVKVVLIATRREVVEAGLAAESWWQRREYTEMKKSAAKELMAYIRAEKVDAKAALRCLYQPNDSDFDFTVSGTGTLSEATGFTCSQTE